MDLVEKLSMDLIGWAAVITAISAPIVTVFVALRPIRRQVEAINHAVNGKPEGTDSIAVQVDDLHKEIPIPVPVEVNGAALLPLVRLLVADMKSRQADGE